MPDHDAEKSIEKQQKIQTYEEVGTFIHGNSLLRRMKSNKKDYRNPEK